MKSKKGKSLFIPYGMIFKKHYCSSCGWRLEREMTHRTVDKSDRDYYSHKSRGTVSNSEIDVYGYRFYCPKCRRRTAYLEQMVYGRIQKMCGRLVLSPEEIRENYDKCKEKYTKSLKTGRIATTCIFSLAAIFFLLLYALGGKQRAPLFVAIGFGICAVTSVIEAYRERCGGKYSYPYEEEAEYQRLHAYSSHNRVLIGKANRCYCFHCTRALSPAEITRYADDGETALCPHCGIDAVIPDSIGSEVLTEMMVREMNKYWF